MARLVTLGALRARVQKRCSMEGVDALFSTADFNQLINDSASEFNDLLFSADQATCRSSTLINLVSGTDHYPLPSDFLDILKVEYQTNATAVPPWVPLHRTNFNESNRYSQVGFPVVNGYFPYRYYFEGQGQGLSTVYYIVICPSPSLTGTIRVWYRPVYQSMVADSDAIDGVNGMDEYIVVDAAIKALQSEESDTSVLFAQKQALLQRVEAMAKDRDSYEPAVISDYGRIHSELDDGGYGWGSGGMY